jgi:hypothetical protein
LCPLCLCGESDFLVLSVNRYRRPEFDVAKENLRHFSGHPDATV